MAMEGDMLMMDEDFDMLEFEQLMLEESAKNEKQIEEERDSFLATLLSGIHKVNLENSYGIAPEGTDFDMNGNENENMEFVQSEESNNQEVDGSGDTLMEENKLELEEKAEDQNEDEVEEEGLRLASFGTLSKFLKPNKDIQGLIQMVTPRIIEIIAKSNISSQVPIPIIFEVIEFQTLVYRNGSHYFAKIKDSNEKFWHIRLLKEFGEDPILRCLALKNNIFDTFDYSEKDIDSWLYY